jgi:hypothetical protein
MKLHHGKEIVLAISDLQAPYEHPDALAFLAAVKAEYKPTKIVCIGDSLDQHTLGKWTANPDLPGPKDEYEQGIAFMKKLYKLFPKATEVVSNHNSRYIKRITEAGIPSSFIKSYRQIMKYPKGWKIAEQVEIDGVQYEHGTRFGGQSATRQAIQTNGQSTVFGHLHSGGSVTYAATRKQMLFAMNVGCLIDYSKLAFAYAKDSKLRPTLGTGIIRKGVPHFIPLLINDKGRWIGKL